MKARVECDIYSLFDDDTQDLAIVRVTRGCKTPLQEILQGTKTIEGFLNGEGTLTVRAQDGTTATYPFNEQSTEKEVVIHVGQIMQWTAPNHSDLTL